MSRVLRTIAKRGLRSAPVMGRVVSANFSQPVAFTPFAGLSVRSFSGDHHHGLTHSETFLDVKEVTDRVIEVVKGFEKVNAAKVTGAARFKEDLDLDSLDAVEVVMAIEEEFCIEIPDSEADKIFSVADAVAYISTHPMAK